jgi:AGZA family xanthine/uracil permease-like MFS transporter
MSHPLLAKLFGFDSATTTVRTEIVAGLTTFLTMAYILAVNPNILAATGMDKGALFTATALASAFATFLMAFYGKLPFGLAPGMGLNAFFAYTVCLTMGYSWQFALTAVFIEGILFILLTITNLREKIVSSIPLNLQRAIGAGIGLFIAFIGLQNAGIVVNDDATLVKLGNVLNPTTLLAFFGLALTGCLLVKKVKGALLVGILLTTLVGVPFGLTEIKGIFDAPPSLSPIFCHFEWGRIFTKDMVLVVFTFLFTDLFDTMGTLVGVCMKADMVDKNGEIPRLKQAFLSDAVGTTAGAMLGTSAIVTYVESASGVVEGGRSGLTAFVIGICFLCALFLAPFFLSVPVQATAPVLILVGLMMLTIVKNVNLEEFSESIPAFICIIFMPLTYSIAHGIVFGMLSYVAINLLCGNFRKLNIGMYVLTVLFVLMFMPWG